VDLAVYDTSIKTGDRRVGQQVEKKVAKIPTMPKTYKVKTGQNVLFCPV